MKKIERKKSKFYKEDVLDRFEKSLKRDKSKDIIKGNFLMNNKIKYNEMLFDFLNSRVRDLFSDFVVKMNDKDERLFIEGLNRKIEIRKMF
jgi:hypothetical protein